MTIKLYEVYAGNAQSCRLDTLPEFKVEWLNKESQKSENGDTHNLFRFLGLGIDVDVTYRQRGKTLVRIEVEDGRIEGIYDFMEKMMGGKLVEVEDGGKN